MSDGDENGALPAGWAVTTLHSLTETQLGKTINPRERGTEPCHPYLRSINVQWGRFDLSDVAEMYFSDQERARLAIREGDLMVCEGGEVGRTAVWTNEGSNVYCFQNALHRVRPRAVEISPSWLFHHLRFLAVTGVLAERSRGSTILHLSQGALRQLPLRCAPAREQHRIADRLDEIEGRRATMAAHLQAARAVLERFRSAVLAAACSGRLTADWREENSPQPSAEMLERKRAADRKRLGHKYVQPILPDPDSLPILPDEWCWALLPELGELGRGRSRHRPRNDPTLYGGEFPFIQTGDVAQSGGLVTCHTQTYNERGLAQSRLWPNGTVCITIAANIADSALLSYPACFPDSVVGLIADRSIALPEYVELFVRTARQDLAAFAPATAQANINLAILSNVAVPLPSIAEQHEIIRRADAALSIADRLCTQLDHTAATLDRISRFSLAKAFRGELVPTEAALAENDEHDFESAAELLARIATPAALQGPRRRRRKQPA